MFVRDRTNDAHTSLITCNFSNCLYHEHRNNDNYNIGAASCLARQRPQSGVMQRC